MAKRRSLQEDVTTLKTKIQEFLAQGDNSEEKSPIRSLRKRLKRTQRKARMVKRQEDTRQSKKATAEV